MTARFWPATLAALFASAAVNAEPILVQSGEHETFTRLVMELPGDLTWRLTDGDKMTTLSIDAFDEGFDVSRAFNIIPRTRLNALLAKPSSLELQLNCDCSVTGFVEAGQFLVLDIRDANPEPQVVELPPKTMDLPTSQFSFGDLLWSMPPALEPQLSVAPPAPEEKQEQEEPIDAPTPEMTEILGRIQDQLTEAFSQAASQGLVDPIITAPSIEEPEDTVALAPEPSPEPEKVEQREDIARSNIKITSSKDLPEMSREDVVGLSGATCGDPGLVHISAWSDSDDFNAERNLSNAELYDELGKLQSNKLVKRAKLYLYFGMGAEAMQILKMNPKIASKYPELIDMAQYFEYGYIPNPRILHQFTDCDSDLALWSVLAAQELSPETPVDVRAALRGLEKLPGHLKYFIAEDVSARLLQRGDLENASIAIRSFRRLPESDAKDPKLVEAQAEMLRREETSAKQILQDVIAEGSPDSHYALAELIDTYIQNNEDVPADMALLAESYAFELKNSPDGAVLLRAHILAAASSSQFDKAFDILANDGAGLSEATRYELLNFILSKMTTTASDPAFLTSYFVQVPDKLDALHPQTALALAERLFNLGFAEEAETMLGTVPADAHTEQVKILSARLMIDRGAFEESIVELAEIDAADASALKATALEGMGESEAAVQLFRDADQAERADAASWLSDDWSSLVDPEHPLFGSVARLSSEELTDVIGSDEPLARTEAALAASGAARETLEGLLNTLGRPE